MTSPLPTKLTLAEKLAYGAGDLGPAMTANLLVFFSTLLLHQNRNTRRAGR